MDFLPVPVSFTGRIDPRAARIRSHTKNWAARMGLVSPKVAATSFDSLGYADLATGYSFGATEHGAQVLADLTAWFFIFDDQHDRAVAQDRSPEWNRLMDGLRAAVHTPDRRPRSPLPLVRALGDIMRRTYPCFSATWWHRFVGHWDGVLDAWDQEFTNRRAGTYESVKDYILLRRRSVAMFPWMDLVELTARTELAPQVHESRDYQTCSNATIDFCAWCNDLHSLAKENNARDSTNIVAVIQHATACTREAAVQDVRRRMAARLEDFLQAERALTSSTHGEPGLRRCLLSMRDWMANMDAWHRSSSCYHIIDTDARIQPYNDDLYTTQLDV